MRWPFDSCRDHRKNVSLLASGALPEAEETSVRDHLAHCAACREYYEGMARLRGVFQQWARTAPPVQVGAAFRARWMRSIEMADRPTRSSLASLIARWGERLWPSPVAWGGLAAVWIWLIIGPWAPPAQRALGHELAGDRSGGTVISFTQRQSELSSLLESLVPPPAPLKPEPPRPRSQRRAESVTI